MATTSRLSGLRNDEPAERLEKVRAQVPALSGHLDAIRSGGLDMDRADRMVEHVVGQIGIPLGVATNFIVNGREVLVPMATEEPSVIAAASNIARMTRDTGGFFTSSTLPLMQAQIQLLDVLDPYGAKLRIKEHEQRILELANAQDPRLIEIGGGARELIVRVIEGKRRTHVVVHLVVHVGDAMGANAVNTMAEAVAPGLSELSGGRSLLRILTNKADLRLSRARCVIPAAVIGGKQVVEDMVAAVDFAIDDPYRAATHNKGIMNGISSVVLATGNDTRAVEAGAHSHAVRGGQYSSLSNFDLDAEGNLSATLELPIPVGLVGGATRTHPTAQAAVTMSEVDSAQQLAELTTAVGLAQNIAAVRALAAEGIQQGHMALHARNVAASAGATADEIDAVSSAMVSEGAVRVDVAERLLAEGRAQR
ncbi:MULTISPECIES: hydroxymethylglutaryl-CoA reductase, degradative [Brachybacterium]|uniref:3-hydroxy-3-methylglutaryl coenzyme A reductase n=1 Tax=Brachybacterium conglomeratum TaxID=47846 RepID=A0ABQ5RHG5_9MICO|nr:MULTISPECIES: hydroxymethylglutaryl-CoA reductase, degradative [Brachybacterium]MCT1437599.1 hydroxymethylglutaryl-CoA reductase, degradative [Brachybacterium paraconglomeratum]GLI31326.1 3-hydroxy-3-methylglutaryl coenzyme A reductase [Brachybacterium conglomeratum]